jgi:ABC-type multidrug transport system permease subunit
MLAIPPLVALVDFILSRNSDNPPIVLGVLVFLALLTAASLAQNEILKEKTVYQRENRSTLESFPYILSKVSIVGVFAIYQGLVWSIVHFAAMGKTGNLMVLGPYAITFFLVAFIGGIVGLLVSASSRTAMITTNWILLITVPQLILSGAIVPLAKLAFPFKILSAINPSRYALHSLLSASGYGKGLSTALATDWLILAIISLVLIALLVGIQQRAGSIRM